MSREVVNLYDGRPENNKAKAIQNLAIRNIAKNWTMPIRDWKPALNRLAMEFAERFQV